MQCAMESIGRNRPESDGILCAIESIGGGYIFESGRKLAADMISWNDSAESDGMQCAMESINRNRAESWPPNSGGIIRRGTNRWRNKSGGIMAADAVLMGYWRRNSGGIIRAMMAANPRRCAVYTIM